jgi:hypothetical protein
VEVARAPNPGYVGIVRSASIVLVSVCLGLAACGDDDSAPSETAATGEEAPATGTAATGEDEASTLDPARVESALTKTLDGVELVSGPDTFLPLGGGAPEQVGPLDIRSVTCPEDVPLEEGGEFSCEIDGSQDGSVDVTQLDSSGDRASYKAVFDLEQLGIKTTIEGKTELE